MLHIILRYYYLSTVGEGTGSKRKLTEKEMLSDLIVLGLPYAFTEDDLKSYFEKYGQLAHYEVSNILRIYLLPIKFEIEMEKIF